MNQTILSMGRANAVFQKSFGARKTMLFGDMDMYLAKQLRETLEKPPRKRTQAEIEVLASTAKIAFFEDFKRDHGDQRLYELLRTCYYEYIYVIRFAPKGEVVIEVDAIGSEFYILLEGKIQFYSKGNPQSEQAKQVTEIARQYPEIPTHSNKRLRSKFDGTLTITKVFRK